MKKCTSVLIGMTMLLATAAVSARTIDPIVSTEWLDANLAADNLVIVDIRSQDAYDGEHIVGAVSGPWVVPFSAWITMSADGLLLEMPDANDLQGAVGALGIDAQSRVVVVGAPNPGEPIYYGPAGAARVALTLIFAGVKNVAILDGGYPKWIDEDRAVTTAVPPVTPAQLRSRVKSEMIASLDEVVDSLYWSTLLDARDADVYFGSSVEPFAPAGHIPGAKALPTPWAYDVNDDIVTFKNTDMLADMAAGVIRTSWPLWKPVKSKAVIVYCGVGGYGAVWTYLLKEVLGYRHVQLYDGSAQQWGTQYPMVTYKWE